MLCASSAEHLRAFSSPLCSRIFSSPKWSATSTFRHTRGIWHIIQQCISNYFASVLLVSTCAPDIDSELCCLQVLLGVGGVSLCAALRPVAHGDQESCGEIDKPDSGCSPFEHKGRQEALKLSQAPHAPVCTCEDWSGLIHHLPGSGLLRDFVARNVTAA